MKKILSFIILAAITIISLPSQSLAAGGIYASGGGAKTVGQTFTITVAASGADFDSLQGTVAVSGPVDIVSFSGTGATFLPGKSPTNGGEFVGICSATSSLTIVSIKLKGKSVGNGSVTVGGVKLARNGIVTGTGAGGTDFSIVRAPEPPGTVTVTSPTHPDQNTPYEATTVTLNWEKAAKTTGFSYVFDASANTTPAAKETSAGTSITYPDQAIGEHYFHIRGHNGDGWGPTTHFKITIKEPDAKVDESLAKPSELNVHKADNFENNPTEGTVTGVIISGKTEPNYTANITLTPTITLPEGKTLTALADENGSFEILLDYPIPAGPYKLTVQGQLEKVLTPISDEIRFEISQAKGGLVSMLSADDKIAPPPPPAQKWYEKFNWLATSIGLLVLSLILGTLLFFVIFKHNKFKKMFPNLQN